MAKDRRTRDQKRKAKLAANRRKSQQKQSLAYFGDRYKTDKFVHALMHAEIGIYETFVMTDRKLLDLTVRDALETMIRQLRAGTLPPLSDSDIIDRRTGQEEELVIFNIRRNWVSHFETSWRPSREQRIGILRTILGSVETMRGSNPRSQRYLHHIAGFLTKKLGVSVEMSTRDPDSLPEPDEDDLLLLGRRWLSGPSEAAHLEFRELAGELLSSSESGRVDDACHRLLAEFADISAETTDELTELMQPTSRSQGAAAD